MKILNITNIKCHDNFTIFKVVINWTLLNLWPEIRIPWPREPISTDYREKSIIFNNVRRQYLVFHFVFGNFYLEFGFLDPKIP